MSNYFAGEVGLELKGYQLKLVLFIHSFPFKCRGAPCLPERCPPYYSDSSQRCRSFQELTFELQTRDHTGKIMMCAMATYM